MTVTHYQSSKGPKPIADMPLPYLTNAMVSRQATLLEQEAAK